MDLLVAAAGALLVVLALRDVFHTLWHPSGQGRLSSKLSYGMWRVLRRLPERSGAWDVAGPLMLVVVIASWGSLVVVGWALVYWPFMPEAFSYSSRPPAQDGWGRFVEAVYVSLMNGSTLGLGDIVPITGWMRVLGGLEAFVGFALLTASVSWVSQVAPALTRRRALASWLTELGEPGLATADARGGLARTLEGVARDLRTIRVDVTQYGETYYFRDRDLAMALPASIGVAVDLADRCRASSDPDVRRGAAELARSLEGYADALAGAHVRSDGTPADVFAAYAADHHRRLGGLPPA